MINSGHVCEKLGQVADVGKPTLNVGSTISWATECSMRSDELCPATRLA